MTISGKQYTVDFSRQLTPVTFFRQGRQVSEQRMATTCALVDDQGLVVDTATVRQFHRDRYSRKAANEAAFRKLAKGPCVLWRDVLAFQAMILRSVAASCRVVKKPVW